MDIEWKKDMQHSYLIIKKEEKNNYRIKMILNNPITGLIRPKLKIINNHYYFSYETTSLVPVLQVIDQLSSQELKNLLEEMISILQEGKEYLLNEDDYILDPEYMFYSQSERALKLCYFDGYQISIKKQFCGWMEYLIGKVNYKDRENIVLIYGLYKISTDENCTFHDLKEFLNSCQEETKIKTTLKKNEKDTEEISCERNDSEEREDNEQEKLGSIKDLSVQKEKNKLHGKELLLSSVICCFALAVIMVLFYLLQSNLLRYELSGRWDLQKVGCVAFIALIVESYCIMKIKDIINECKSRGKPTEKRINENGMKEEIIREDLIYEEGISDIEDSEDDQTVVLGEISYQNRFLLKPKEADLYEDIILVEFPFFVGKLKTKADGIIKSNLVSRFHAKFDREQDTFYLTDLDSTNGTYLNGIKLCANERVRLNPDDEISFANIAFYFMDENAS